MSSVVAINPLAEIHNDRHLPVTVDAWKEASPEARETALKRELFLTPVIELIEKGVSQRNAIANVLAHIESGLYAESYLNTAAVLGRKNQPPKRATIARWLKLYTDNGKVGLLDNYTGRVRKVQGWEAVAMRLYNIPSKPSYAAVARKLREEYQFADASDSAVRRYLKSLPAEMGELSPARMGRKLYNNTQRHYIHRTTENLRVGDLYQGDGHTLDVYLEHPVTGDIWRAELTVWMDIRSRYIVGWYISNAESAIDTIRCLTSALTTHNHVPPILYVDNGSGYKSKMMSDEATGFYQRLNMECIFAIPGNAKAKGQIERWFRTMERDCNVWFGDAFCGENMAKDVSTKFVNDCKRGIRKPPSLMEWCDVFTQWLDKYHNRPHPELKNTTPAELWTELDNVRNPVHMEALELLRPQKRCKVVRGKVRLDNREYKHVELVSYNRHDVIVEYDLHTDAKVTVRTAKGELICDATLVAKSEYIPTSRIEEARKKAAVAAVKRLEKKADEKRLRAGMVIDHTDTLAALGEMADEAPAITDEADDDFEIDYSLTPGSDQDDDDLDLNLEGDD